MSVTDRREFIRLDVAEREFRARHAADLAAAKRARHQEAAVVATALVKAEAEVILRAITPEPDEVTARRRERLEIDTHAYDVGRPLRREG